MDIFFVVTRANCRQRSVAHAQLRLTESYFPLPRTKLRKKQFLSRISQQLLVAAVIFGGDAQTLAGKTIFFQFSITIGVHFFNLSLQFFQICFFKIQKKIALRAMLDLLLNWRASRFHFHFFKYFYAQFLFFPPFNSLFFQQNFCQFYLLQFSLLVFQKSKEKFFKQFFEFRFSIFVNSLVNFTATRSHRR